MQVAERILTLKRKQTPGAKQPVRLPLELRSATIEALPAATEQLLESTPFNLRDDVIEQLVRAVKSDDEDTKSRAWISLVTIGRTAVPALGQQLMEHRDRGYRLRLVRLLGEIGQQHREAMMPLLHLLSTTKVPEVMQAARCALLNINPGSRAERQELSA